MPPTWAIKSGGGRLCGLGMMLIAWGQGKSTQSSCLFVVKSKLEEMGEAGTVWVGCKTLYLK